MDVVSLRKNLQNTFILFRKEINIDREVKSAKGWIVADSRYQLFVNGRRIQLGPAPCDPRWQEADPVDISKFLKPGKNVIAWQVLFYGAGDGTSPLGIPGFMMKLNIDGKEVVTESSWKSFLARSWNPGQYNWHLRSLQEYFDARIFPYDWDLTGFTEDTNGLPQPNCAEKPRNRQLPTVIQTTNLIFREMLNPNLRKVNSINERELCCCEKTNRSILARLENSIRKLLQHESAKCL